jgi:hypothetical protein
MVDRQASKDLFGRPIQQRRPRYEATLEKADKRMLSERAARARWLAEIIPKRTYFGMPTETFYILDETTSSFIYENYVAVILLATSFVEHWFAAHLSARGYEKEAPRGLSASIQTARRQNLVETLILDKADRLRLIRNPFVHLKPFEHEHNLGRRSLRLGAHPKAILEQDAKDAIIALYAVAVHAFGRS